jgi:hypothetical protein
MGLPRFARKDEWRFYGHCEGCGDEAISIKFDFCNWLYCFVFYHCLTVIANEILENGLCNSKRIIMKNIKIPSVFNAVATPNHLLCLTGESSWCI